MSERSQSWTPIQLLLPIDPALTVALGFYIYLVSLESSTQEVEAVCFTVAEVGMPASFSVLLCVRKSVEQS